MDFDTFVGAMEGRYGKSLDELRQKQTDDEMALDYYEWPPQGDFTLRAYDATTFYNNFCLSIIQVAVDADRKSEPSTARRASVTPTRTSSTP